eukprot:SAG31_NODE_28913_length_403_cov_1.358553_1_plen_44_part_01
MVLEYGRVRGLTSTKLRAPALTVRDACRRSRAAALSAPAAVRVV